MSTLSQFLNGAVKSIQKGTILIAGAANQATATVSAVNAAKSVPFFGGATTNFGADLGAMPYLELVNSTTVRATRSMPASSSGSTTVAYFLVEFR